MFSKNLIDWIYSLVKDDYSGDIYGDIALFEKALMLNATDTTLEGVNTVMPGLLEEMSSSSLVLSQIQERMNGLKTEPFLKHLFSVLYPERYALQPRKETNGLDFSEWTFVPLLKQAFNLIPTNYNISSGKPETTVFPYKEQYDLVYASRNLSAHGYLNMGLKKTFEVITATLIVYLDVSSRLCFQIEEAYNKENVDSGFQAILFCRNIISKYNMKVGSGFTYVDIKWKSNNSRDTEYSTVENISNSPYNLIKLLGEAGCGKTTILRQLEYINAKNFIDGKTTVIPVFVPLGDTEINASLRGNIKTIISKVLSVDDELLEKMLSLNTVALYLDGFNEILDTKLKKQIAWSIDDLSKEYPSLKIFLSDRSLVRSSIDTMKNAVSYKLYPLDNAMKSTFIKLNCADQQIKDMLLIHLSLKPNEFEKFNTPIKLKQLIELATFEKRIPIDFDEEYIKFLFERELIDKKDENVEYLESFACALAICEDEKMTEYKAEACIAKCKSVLGYTEPDSRKCLRLLIEMGILTFEDNIIEFKYPSYRNYFWTTAFDKGLTDLLED